MNLVKHEAGTYIKNPSLLVLVFLPVFISKIVISAMPVQDQAGTLLPSWILFAEVMVGIMLSGPNLLEERTNKTIDALLTTPLSYRKILMGKGVTVLSLSLVSQLLVITVNGALTKLSLLLLLVLVLGGILFIHIGYVVGMMMNSPRNGTAVSSVLMVSLFLSGTIYQAFPKLNHLLSLIPSIQVVKNIQSVIAGDGLLGWETTILGAWIFVLLIFVAYKAKY